MPVTVINVLPAVAVTPNPVPEQVLFWIPVVATAMPIADKSSWKRAFVMLPWPMLPPRSALFSATVKIRFVVPPAATELGEKPFATTMPPPPVAEAVAEGLLPVPVSVALIAVDVVDVAFPAGGLARTATKKEHALNAGRVPPDNEIA